MRLIFVFTTYIFFTLILEIYQGKVTCKTSSQKCVYILFNSVNNIHKCRSNFGGLVHTYMCHNITVVHGCCILKFSQHISNKPSTLFNMKGRTKSVICKQTFSPFYIYVYPRNSYRYTKTGFFGYQKSFDSRQTTLAKYGCNETQKWNNEVNSNLKAYKYDQWNCQTTKLLNRNLVDKSQGCCPLYLCGLWSNPPNLDRFYSWV